MVWHASGLHNTKSFHFIKNFPRQGCEAFEQRSCCATKVGTATTAARPQPTSRMDSGGASSSRPDHGAYPECAMLDALTHKQRYYMFNAVKPQYKSHAGKQMDPNFSWKQKTSPMVFSPEAGLVMYERVVVGQQEAMMLNKLSKPKTSRAPVASSKPSKAQEKLAGTQMPQPGWAYSNQGAVERSSASASASASRAAGQESGSLGEAGRPRTGRLGSGRGVNAVGTTTTAGAGAAGAVGGTGSSAGAAVGTAGGGGAAAGGAAGASARPSMATKYGISAALQPSREEQEMQKYVNRERAVMTASHVFTWGGRIKYSGPENGLSRQPWATGLSKPPLRL